MRVVICGGGVIGASIAYFLSRRGVAATVVERTALACAASGKSGGFLAFDWCDGTPLEKLARRSFRLHAQLAEEIDADWGFRRLVTYGGFASPTGCAGSRRARTTGLALRRCVVLDRTLGTTETTAQVLPEKFAAAMMRAAEANGATLSIGTRHRHRACRRDRRPASSSMVKSLAGRCGRDRHGAVVGARVGMASAPSRLRAEGPQHHLRDRRAIPAGSAVPRIRGCGRERALAGDLSAAGRHGLVLRHFERQPAAGSIPRRSRPIPARWSGWRRSVAAFAGARRRRRSLARQACFRPVTRDGLPLIGAIPGLAGAYVATGHSVWGILNAPATGEAMAELILDGAAQRRSESVRSRPPAPARSANRSACAPDAASPREDELAPT